MTSHIPSRRRSIRSRVRLSLRARRGIALFISMFFVAGIGALALSAIYLTANASLISKSYEKEDDLKYASEAALAIGKSSLNFNPAALPNTSYVSMMSNRAVQTADGSAIPNVTVNLWVGQTGSVTGQFGRFASLVAEARDLSGVGFVRRLELSQESFAKYAYWTNSETNNGSPIYFGNGDQIWGPVWSNDDININTSTSGATFRDQVGTAGVINGVGSGTFMKGYSINQRPINLPPLTTLSSLAGLAAVGGMSFTGRTTGDESTLRQRIEFVAVDLNLDGDSTDADEGFFRFYEVPAGRESWIRGDWPNGGPPPLVKDVKLCGDFHYGKFFPVAIHPRTWFRDTLVNRGMSLSSANTHSGASVQSIMNGSGGGTGARCYLGGDPHLAAIQRQGLAPYIATNRVNIGGEDTTITGLDSAGGQWLVGNPTPTGPIAAARPNDARYLYPLYRGFNTSTKGVIYVSGTVGISGVLRLDKGVTVYSPFTIVLLDDMRYANDPAATNRQCNNDIMGIIAGGNIVVADNAINTPQLITSSARKSLDDTPDMYIHAVMMALGTSFTVENYGSAPSTGLTCQTTTNGRGCLYLTGGVIQNNRGPVGQSNGNGFIKRYSYDRCGAVNPPPYFPTTGRFQDNRYYELDPVRFNIGNLFRSIQPNP